MSSNGKAFQDRELSMFKCLEACEMSKQEEERISKSRIQGSRCGANNAALQTERKREQRFTWAVCVGFVEAEGISF